MVTINAISKINSEKPVCEGYCLSTDSKPTVGIGNGSFITEIDTGKVFCFDEENETWYEWLTLMSEEAAATLSSLSLSPGVQQLNLGDQLTPGIVNPGIIQDTLEPMDLTGIEDTEDAQAAEDPAEEQPEEV